MQAGPGARGTCRTEPNPREGQHDDDAGHADAHVEPPVDLLLSELLDHAHLAKEQQVVLQGGTAKGVRWGCTCNCCSWFC